MKKFEQLTKYIPSLNNEQYDIALSLENDIYQFCDNHLEYNHKYYQNNIEKYGIHWNVDEMTNADVTKLPAKGVVNLLVAVLRADHFSEGTYDEVLHNGVILKWLQRLSEIDDGKNLTAMSDISIIQTGITNIGTEAIVNAANDGLWEGGGVCGAIFKAAGSAKLAQACHKLGDHCDTGSAVITPGFNLCPYIIHAVGPKYIDGKHHEPNQLYDCYKAALNLAKENDIHSIGFPLISAGIFGYPTDGAWRKAIQACNKFIIDNPDYEIDIRFAVPDDHKYQMGIKTLNGIVNTSLEEKTTEKNNSSFDEGEVQKAIDSLLKMEPYPILNFVDYDKTNAGHDYNWYIKHHGSVIVSKLSLDDCENYIDYLYAQERFCTGFVDGCMRDGTFLRILFRVQDLLKMEN